MAASQKLTYCFLMFSFVWLLTAQPSKEIPKISCKKEFVVTIGKGTRKIMALHNVMRIIGKARDEGVTAVTVRSNSKVSKQVKGNSERQNLEFEQRFGSRFSAAQFDEAQGFVAFNEDYSEPRRHPPKNN